MIDNDKKLIFVRPIGENSIGYYEYDFYFTDNSDEVWGEDWEVDYPNQIENMLPDEKTYTDIIRLKTQIPFFCIQFNNCFSMQHVVDGIVSICFEDISDYESYPEPYRIVFQYGEDFHSIENKLASRHQFFDE